MKLLYVDTPSLLMRRFHAIHQGDIDTIDPALSDSIKATVKETFEAITRRVKIEDFADFRLAFETPEIYPVWRYEVYPDYKHAVSEPREPLVPVLQAHLAHKMNEAGMANKIVYAPRAEADDALATMVTRSLPILEENPHMECIIWTKDSDLYQVLRPEMPSIRILVDGDYTLLGYEEATESLGYEPKMMPLVQALVGDKGANIIGIKGIGPKTVMKILRPARYRIPTPYMADPELTTKENASKLLSEWPRVVRDERLLTLMDNLELISGGNHYLFESELKEQE